MSRLKARPRRVLCWVLSFAMALQALPLLAFADPPTPAVAQYPPFLIGPGDMLSVTVYGEKDLPDKYLVDSTGAIEFPLVGPVMLGSMTQLEASQALPRAL